MRSCYISQCNVWILELFFFVSFAGSTVSSSVKYDVPSRECYQRHHPIVAIVQMLMLMLILMLIFVAIVDDDGDDDVDDDDDKER